MEGRPRATIASLFMFTCRGILGSSTQLPLPKVGDANLACIIYLQYSCDERVFDIFFLMLCYTFHLAWRCYNLYMTIKQGVNY